MKHRVKYVDITSQWGIGTITEIIDDIWIADIIFCGKLFYDVHISILDREHADLDFEVDDVFIYHVWKKDVLSLEPARGAAYKEHLALCVHSVCHLSDEIADFVKNVYFLECV